MMFKKAVVSSVVLILLIVLYIIYYCFYILPKDVKRYEDYLQSVQSKRTHHDKPTEQHRTGVQKDIWHFDGRARLHYQILADSSILTLAHSAHPLTLQEHLQHIHCAVQEKLYYDTGLHPMQQTSTFYASHGIYDFTRHHFRSETVFLKFYTLPGHSLLISPLGSPFLQGRAQDVSLTLSHRGPAFHAEKFIAHMDLKEYEH
jgi:hypothetical protein